MFSYHRVLKLFGRTVGDKTLECDWYGGSFDWTYVYG